MEFGFTLALGVDCTHCHAPAFWDSDEKPTKQIARDMSAMMAAINNEYLKKIPEPAQHKSPGELHDMPPGTAPARAGAAPAGATAGMKRAAGWACLALLIASVSGAQSLGTPPKPVAEVVTHDNREPAGTITGNVLKVRLEAVRADWRPEGADGPVRDVYAFAVEGGPPNIPGPLLRVPQGTELHVFVRNRLSVPLKLHGVGPRPRAKDDFVTMAPGKGLEFRFKAGTAGTYYYWGQTADSSFAQRTGIDSQLTGAFIVDGPGSEPDADRVFLIGEWLGPIPPQGVPRKVTIVVNGRSWPHTERRRFPSPR